MLGRAGLEAHALDALSDEKFETMLLHGPDGKYEAAAPEASVEDRVIDCEDFSIRLYYLVFFLLAAYDVSAHSLRNGRGHYSLSRAIHGAGNGAA